MASSRCHAASTPSKWPSERVYASCVNGDSSATASVPHGDRFDDFYCDDRVVPMLGKLLGKSFFDRKRQPISVRVTRGPESLRQQLRKADVEKASKEIPKASTEIAPPTRLNGKQYIPFYHKLLVEEQIRRECDCVVKPY